MRPNLLAGLVGGASIPLRIVATRGEVMLSTIASSGSLLRHTSRARHRTGASALTTIDAAWSNYYVSGSRVETSNANDVTVKAHIEIPGAPTPVVVAKWGGASSFVMVGGKDLLPFDEIPASAFGLATIPANTDCYTVFEATVASAGMTFLRGVAVEASSGEGGWIASTAFSAIGVAGALSTPSGGSTQTSIWYPAAVLGRQVTPQPAVILCGGASMYGQFDSAAGFGLAGGGAYRRGLWNVDGAGTAVAWASQAVGVTRLNQWISQYTKQVALWPYATHLITDFGGDDLANGRSPLQVMNDLQTLWEVARVAGIQRVEVQTAINRCATSTDGWATAANMTPSTNFQTGGTLREPFNLLLADQVGFNGLTATFDCTANWNDATLTDRIIGGYSTDGIRPNATGYVALAQLVAARAATWTAALAQTPSELLRTVSPYNRYPTALKAAGGTTLRMVARAPRHIGSGDVKSLRIRLDNTRIDLTGMPGAGNSFTVVEAWLEIGSQCVQLTKGGSTTWTVRMDQYASPCDKVLPAAFSLTKFSRNLAVYVRIIVEVATTKSIPILEATDVGAAGTYEGYSYDPATNSVTNISTPGQAIAFSGAGTPANEFGIPVLLIGEYEAGDARCWLVAGDSITANGSRASYPAWAFYQDAAALVSGLLCGHISGNYSMYTNTPLVARTLQRLANGCIEEFGTNEIAVQNLAQLQADEVAIWLLLRQSIYSHPSALPYKLVRTSLLVSTYPSADVQTLGGQTITANWGNSGLMDQFCAWLATQVGVGSGVNAGPDVYVDVREGSAGSIRGGANAADPNYWKWGVGDNPPHTQLTQDGLHPNPTSTPILGGNLKAALPA